MLACTTADVAGWTFLALVYRAATDDVWEGEERRITFKPGRIVEAHVEEGKAADHIGDFERKYDTTLNRLSKNGEILEIGEFRGFLVHNR